MNAANHRVYEAFSAIQTGLPFPLKGAHYDNGMEFINEPLFERGCRAALENKSGKGQSETTLLSGGWSGPSGLISARFLLLGNRPVSTRLILRQCAVLIFWEIRAILEGRQRYD
jgi:hypothetical protein